MGHWRKRLALPDGRYATARVYPDAESLRAASDRIMDALGTVPDADRFDAQCVTWDSERDDGSPGRQAGVVMFTEASADDDGTPAHEMMHLVDRCATGRAHDHEWRGRLLQDLLRQFREWRRRILAHRKRVRELVAAGLATADGDGPWDLVALTPAGERRYRCLRDAFRPGNALPEADRILGEYVRSRTP